VLSIAEITSERQFRTLHTAWDDLLKKSHNSSPFFAHAWFQCCFAGYAQQKHLFILVVRDGPDVVGIAPLWRFQDTLRRIPVWRIGFITIPDTPVVDFILHRERHDAALRAIFHHLCHDRRGLWDVLSLGQWPAESPHQAVVRELLESQRRRLTTAVASLSPYISIDGRWEAFLQTRSVRFRKTHRNIINRMAKLGKLEIQCYHQDPTGTVFDDILRVSGRSWKQRAGLAISNGNAARQFFEALTNMAEQHGWLLIWLLKVDGVPIAMEYDLSCDGRVYALRSDFNEAYREYSPGAYLQYQIIKYLFDHEYLEYNAGPGMNSYKLHWTEQIRENIVLHVYNNNLKGSLIWTLEQKVWPFLKRIRNLKPMSLAKYKQ
jgi:CelD/BcsL family acetyltransferase involved in cellulose biosynthesis